MQSCVLTVPNREQGQQGPRAIEDACRIRYEFLLCDRRSFSDECSLDAFDNLIQIVGEVDATVPF